MRSSSCPGSEIGAGRSSNFAPTAGSHAAILCLSDIVGEKWMGKYGRVTENRWQKIRLEEESNCISVMASVIPFYTPLFSF
jgi:hypothetical protein